MLQSLNNLGLPLEHSHKYWLFRVTAICFAGCFLLLSCKDSEKIPEFTESNTGPYILNLEHLQFTKEHLDSLPGLAEEYDQLIEGANTLLEKEYKFVVDKQYVPESGTKNDYVSIARYWHIDSTGAQTIYKDGKSTPLIENFDRPKLADMSSAVYTLALSYFFSDDEKYAKKATDLIKSWFLDPNTRMRPNMNFTQIRLGVPDTGGGGTQGIIDANDFIHLIESLSLLYNSHHWTYEDHIAMKEWFYEFSVWIIKNYNPDAFESTNVSTWMDVQRAIYFLFTENKEYLNSSSHILPVSDKIEMQFTPEGTLPNEKSRVRSQHYVYFNLRAYMNLALIRKNRTGIDRDWPVLASGGLRPALETLLLYLEGGDVSTYFNASEEFDVCRYLEIFKPAAIAFEDEKYEQASQMLLDRGCSNPNITLVFPPLSMLEAESEF